MNDNKNDVDEVCSEKCSGTSFIIKVIGYCFALYILASVSINGMYAIRHDKEFQLEFMNVNISELFKLIFN